MDKILSPIKGRLLKYLETKGISRETFYRETGISASNFKGAGLRSELGGDKIAKILRLYPDLNSEWLLRGQGEMYASGSFEEAPASYSETGETLTGNISDVTFPSTDDDAPGCRTVPLYELGPDGGLSLLLGSNTLRPLDRITLPGLPPCDGALRISGDAMEPVLRRGDIVFYKRVDAIPQGFLWGEMYLLSFDMGGTEYVVLRYVRPADDRAHIRLVGQNPRYPDKDISVASIRAAALVRASVRYNTMG